MRIITIKQMDFFCIITRNNFIKNWLSLFNFSEFLQLDQNCNLLPKQCNYVKLLTKSWREERCL